MSATTERTREDVAADLAIANAAARCLRDRRLGVAEDDRLHRELDRLLDELARAIV